MRTGNRRRVFAFTVVVFCTLAGSAWATPCTLDEPTTYLDELFTTCEEWSEGNDDYTGYRWGDLDTDENNDTVTHINRDDFEIDQFGVISLGLDFSQDGDLGRDKWQAQNRRDYCTARVRFRSLVGYLGGGGPAVAEGDVFGYIATEMDGDPGDSDVCNAEVLDNLPSADQRPGVIYLPGFRNPATPVEAAKYAAMFSSQAAQGEESAGKVFLFMIAPPSHIAANLRQIHDETAGESDDDSDDDTGEHCAWPDEDEKFCTLSRGQGNGWYGQLSFGSYGADGGQESFATYRQYKARRGSLEMQQEVYLTDGFLDSEPVEPARNLFFAYIYAADRALNLFDKFFASPGVGWSGGTLHAGGFSIGATVAAALGEIHNDAYYDNTELRSIFAFASHVGIEDNFRIPGNNMAVTIATSGRPFDPAEAPKAPLLAWNCETPSINLYFSQEVLDRMGAGCELARYYSPLNYTPRSYSANRKYLFTQGSSDEPWSVKGYERTYEYFKEHKGEENVQTLLVGDVDHRYYIGFAGGWGLEYFGTTWFPSEALTSGAAYPNFEHNGSFETFINFDFLNPGHGDPPPSDVHGPESLSTNRAYATIREFIRNNSYEENEEPEYFVPPAPFRPTGQPGVLVEKSTTPDGPTTTISYAMTACYDPDIESTYESPDIVFHVSPDRFWHVLPSCEDEGEMSVGNDTYTIDADGGNYDYNSACFDRSAGVYNYKCLQSPWDNSDTNLARDGFIGLAVEDENYECRTFTVAFEGTTANYMAGNWSEPRQLNVWAELRAYDANDRFLAGSTSKLTTMSVSSLLPNGETSNYSQCVRPIASEGAFERYSPLDVTIGFADTTYYFQNFPYPGGSPMELDEWPESVANLEFLDLSGYSVTIPYGTHLETAAHGLTIFTDREFIIEDSASLSVDAGSDDADLTIVARDITIDGDIINDTEESATIRLAALNTISLGLSGSVTVQKNDRDGEEESALVDISAKGDVVILGEINAKQKYFGGSVVVTGDDVTFGTESQTIADATGGTQVGGTITVRATDDLDVQWDYDPYQRAVFSAQGSTEDGTIDFTGCTIDPEQGDFDPSATHHPYECPLTDILDIESVDWCDNYEDNDLCCQVGDPCGYGFDGVCQCAGSCEWDVMDCTGAPVGVQVSNLTDTETPVVGAECVIVDNETGEPVEPEVSTTSDANGFCWFESIENYQTYSVRVTHDDYLPTYLFNLPAPALPIAIMFPTALIGDVEQYFEIEIDPEDGIVVGFVFWSDGGGFEPVGCAEVTSDSGQNTVYYSDEYGPNPELTATSPVNSAFMLFNVPVGGPYEFTATTDEEEVYSTMPQVFASAVTINYLVYGGEYEFNPTPAECE